VVSERAPRLTRANFRVFRPITTRWMDNDVYGHVNNVVYYAYFDSIVNGWLVEQGLLDVKGSPVVGLVVETGCTYFQSIAFPDAIEAGMAVVQLGRSSVRYQLGIFHAGAEAVAAQGRFVHVYVDRATQKPVEIPAATRTALEGISLEAAR
jgi:acyl-CoA thioester hydrolase